MATLEELRRDARKLESMLDVKLVSYSKLGANFAHSTLLREEDHSLNASPWSEDVSNSMALEIDQLLLQLSEINDKMTRCDASVALPHILQHHRGKLHDFKLDFKKTRANIMQTREHADLLLSVRDDISEYKKNTGMNSRTENLLRERGSIHGVDHIADQLIAQAQEARDQLAGQRSLLQNTLATLAGMRGSLPGINSIMGSIKKKKYRDMVVLGSFIAFCICFLLFYWLRS